jgi:hypothetical protein
MAFLLFRDAHDRYDYENEAAAVMSPYHITTCCITLAFGHLPCLPTYLPAHPQGAPSDSHLFFPSPLASRCGTLLAPTICFLSSHALLRRRLIVRSVLWEFLAQLG